MSREPEPHRLYDYWECPRCGAQFGQGNPQVRLTGPRCSTGHAPVRMVPITPARFGRGRAA